MSLTPGSRLGPYEVVAPLGAGGMGEVYRALDTKLNRDVAIKVLPAVFAQDAERVARFRREAHVLASLNHPSGAAIHGLEESDGVVALVLELVEGEELAQRLKRGPIPVDEALAIAKQIAEGLEAAHEKGSSIATSSPRTSRSRRTARSRSSTSASPRPTRATRRAPTTSRSRPRSRGA